MTLVFGLEIGFRLIFVFLLGLCVGSFLNVCVYRLPRDKSLIWSRSHCPNCDSKIGWFDNIPLLSFIFLGGRCRHCGDRISAQYFVGELMSGVVFVICGVWWLTPPSTEWINFFLSAFFIVIAITITRIDWSHSIIPNELNFSLIVSGLLLGAVPHYPFKTVQEAGLSYTQWGQALLGLLIGGGIFLFLALISPLIYGRPALGMGDVKLMAGFGAWMGVKLTILTIIIGSIIGAVIGTTWMWIQGESLRTEIPFGPFLCAGGIIVWIVGQDLWTWYVSLL